MLRDIAANSCLAIVVNQQSLATDSADAAEHFKAQLALATSARLDVQRKDALSYLTNRISSKPPCNPLGTPAVLMRVIPHITDSSKPVRGQLLKLLRAMPPSELRPHVGTILMYVRGGMTHLSEEIRSDTLGVVEWLLEAAGPEAVSCPGGWMKTLNSFSSMLGWNPVVGSAASSKGWTSSTKTALVAKRGPQAQARQIQVLARFLEVGFRPEPCAPYDPRAYWDNIYRLPGTSNAFAHLNLFGTPRDENEDMYPDRQSRLAVFQERWAEAITRGMEDAKKDGGAAGRAAATLEKVLLEQS